MRPLAPLALVAILAPALTLGIASTAQGAPSSGVRFDASAAPAPSPSSSPSPSGSPSASDSPSPPGSPSPSITTTVPVPTTSSSPTPRPSPSPTPTVTAKPRCPKRSGHTDTLCFQYGTDRATWYWKDQADQDVPGTGQRLRLPNPQSPDTLPVAAKQGRY